MSLPDLPLSWKIALAASVVAASAFVVGGVYLTGRHDGKALDEAAAAKAALERISDMEKNNADFHKLDARGRCRVFMRDSRLPVDTCD
ncbi:hypothetical protein [Rhizobium sp. PAMB 3182]